MGFIWAILFLIIGLVGWSLGRDGSKFPEALVYVAGFIGFLGLIMLIAAISQSI